MPTIRSDLAVSPRCLALGAACLLAFVLALAAPPAGAQPFHRRPHPALWKIENGNSRVYIFGSLHILRANVRWMTPVLLQAMAKSQDFVFEVPVGKAPMAEAQAFLDANGYLPEGKHLSALLSPEGQRSYHAVLAGLDLKPEKIERLRPWVAELTLSSSFFMARDYSIRRGADLRIMAYARDHNRTLHYFETPREQLEFFFEAASSTAVVGLEATLQQLQKGESATNLEATTDAWVHGDVAYLAARLDSAVAGNPRAKRILLDDRNRAWAERIETMLTDGRTHFITVGVGHLGGPGSVIALLCADGQHVLRLSTASEHVPPACRTTGP